MGWESLGLSLLPVRAGQTSRGLLAMPESVPLIKLVDVIQALDVEIPMEESDIVTDVVVIARVSSADTDRSSVVVANNAGQDWLVRLGLMESALLMEKSMYASSGCECDECRE